ncbi:VQ motif-containing protein 17-like [Phaseolus vulgaris]
MSNLSCQKTSSSKLENLHLVFLQDILPLFFSTLVSTFRINHYTATFYQCYQEDMTKLHISSPSSLSSKLGVNRDSHVISKFKSEIRIVHIFAPEIIEIDAANFRELVQRLTGKPEEGRGRSNSKTSLTKDPMDSHPKEALIIQDEEEFLSLQNGIRVKDEHEEEEAQDDLWRSKLNKKFSGFLDGFSEFDCLLEELSTTPEVNQD